MRRGLAIVLMWVLLAAVVAAGWAAPESVRLELKGTPGTASRYESKFNMTMDIAVPLAQESNLVVSPRLEGRAITLERVTSVAENGDLTMGTQIESFDVKLDVADLHVQVAIQGPGGGPPQLIKLPALPIEMVISKRGKPVAITGLDKLLPPIPGPGGQKINLGELLDKAVKAFGQPLYPDKSVSVGESWEWKMMVDPAAIAEMLGAPMPAEAKEQLAHLKFPVQTTSTLVGFETINGVECAKIEAAAPWKLSMPMGPEQAESPALRESGRTQVTTWFDYQAGRRVKELVAVSMEMVAPTPAGAQAKVNLEMGADTELR